MRRECHWCGRTFTAKRSDAKFCSNTCRAKNHLSPKAPVKAVDYGIRDSLRAQLETAGVFDTVAAQQALVLAGAICECTSGRGTVVLSRELRRVLTDELHMSAPVPAARVTRPVDELTVRRTKRQKSGYGGKS